MPPLLAGYKTPPYVKQTRIYGELTALPQTYEASRYGNDVILGKLKVLLGLKKIFLDTK